MNLSEVKLNKICVVTNVNILDDLTKIRIMELGVVINTKILVKHKSIFKKTLLIIFNNSCFTISANIAKGIEVKYA